MEGENNSIEIFSYESDGSSRFYVDLSNYYEWWINFDAAQTQVNIYNQELGGQVFALAGQAGELGILHSTGASLPTGYASLWIQPTQAGLIMVMGIRRS